MSSLFRLPLLTIASGALTLAGCGGRDSLQLVPVMGKIALEGKPLTVGAVSLRPADGNPTMHHPTGPIDGAGNYAVFTIGREGAPPGKYKVLVFADGNTSPETGKVAHPAMPKWLVAERYTSEEFTDLSLHVAADAGPGAYDLNLKK